jgi:hypothetical protein
LATVAWLFVLKFSVEVNSINLWRSWNPQSFSPFDSVIWP